MEKFTKGEWEVYGDWGIKSVNSDRIHAEFTELGFNNEIGFANAHLIAAAPEIYYELKNLLHESMHYEDYERIEKLLAKARGEK